MDLWQIRSAVVSMHASVSSDQPFASNVGLDVLKSGGNAADAVIAMAAVLSIIQPMLCGLGGDANVMFFRKFDKKVLSLNGSGRTGRHSTLEKLLEAGVLNAEDLQKSRSGLWVSVPGFPAAMFDTYEQFGSGKLSMKRLLEPAIRMATEGVPLPYKTGIVWTYYAHANLTNSRHKETFLLANGKIPGPGNVIYNPALAKCYKDLAAYGPKAFYEGDLAERIVDEIQYAGGVLTLRDLKQHLRNATNRRPTVPLYTDFHGFRLWEMKPNSIGVVALVAVNILDGIDLKALGHNSAEYIHIVSEAFKLAFIECWDYLADPSYYSPDSPPISSLLTKETAERLRRQIDVNKALETDKIVSGGDTSYLAAVDNEGNGCSFIFSIADIFGSGLIPTDSGFALQNRAKSMSLDRDSSNAFGPNKFPLHSTMPAILTNAETGDLEAIFGVIGRWMQPQGHVQVLLNMVIFGMNPQLAINQPRFRIGISDGQVDVKSTWNFVDLEDGIDPAVVRLLRGKGHVVSDLLMSGFGRQDAGVGHAIARQTVWDRTGPEESVWWAGADSRMDGCAMGI